MMSWNAKSFFHRDACADWEALVERAAVGDLPAAAARALQAHAERCARCCARIERADRLTRLLVLQPQPRWPEGQPLLPPAAAAIAAQSRAPRERSRASAVAVPARTSSTGGLAALRRAAPLLIAGSLLLLGLILFRGRGSTPRRIDLVSPPDGVADAWDVATICATLDPPLAGESLRLRLDERDVTAASELAPDFVLFTSPDPLEPGPHLVALVVEDRGGARLEERHWIVMAQGEEEERP